MAERPVFVPSFEGPLLVHEILVQFHWHRGMSPSRKKMNVVELHLAAKRHGLDNLLEISSKSEIGLGRRLSAFNLKTPVGDSWVFVECAYQGSKVFRSGGPYFDLFSKPPREAKRDHRIRNSGDIIRFELLGSRYPLSPKNAFYDWLYLRALFPHKEWIKKNNKFSGFTDIEFNPGKSINCQARAFAQFVSLTHRKEVNNCVKDFEYFKNLLVSI